MDDDGERYGGDRVLKVLNEVGAVDVLVVCARWFGGDMLGVSFSYAEDGACWTRRGQYGRVGSPIGRRMGTSVARLGCCRTAEVYVER